MATLTIVYWRDIPAQVIAKAGRTSAKRVLPERFEKSIDQSAMHAKLRDTDSYLEHWRRGDAVQCSDDLEAEAEALATKIDAEYTDEVLVGYIRNGGLKPDA